MQKIIRKSLLSTAVALACSQAYAQSSALEEVIVTGTFKAEGQNELDTSISVSSVKFDAVVDAAPTNMAEAFRNLPGIRAESSSGGGNSNIAIRGIPLSTGGAKFLQMHEDGLPVLLFGDFDFAPSDGYLKIDSTMDRIESVRGGTASTLTTNGPGGIINVIGKTGQEEGGSAAIKYGLDHDDFRIDLEQGGELTDSMYYHIGGHFQQGGDFRDSGFDTISGGQIRASLTKEVEKGYIRVTGKIIDKKDAAYFPQVAAISGGSVTDGVAGFDLNADSLQSPYTRFGRDVDGEGRINDRDLADGIHTKVKSIGAELNLDFDNGVTLNNKMRHQDISGDFNGAFTNSVSTVDNFVGDGASVTVFNGPNAGTVISNNADMVALTGNNLISDVAYFHTNLDDMSNFANELKINKSFDFGDGSTLDVLVGHFFMNQNFKQDWHWSKFYTTTTNDAALLEVPGETTDGQAFNQGFGWNGSNRNYDLEYQASAPFAGVQWTNDALTLDASIRRDTLTQSGLRTEATGIELDVNQDGVIGGGEANVSVNTGQVGARSEFEVDNTGYSLGANYRINDTLAVFGRLSSGASFNGERQLGNFVDSGGRLLPGGDDTYVDVVDQLELGVKWKDVEVGSGILDLYATAFFAETEESNTQLTGGGDPTVVNNEYESNGIELESNFSIGGFDLFATITWTDAEITASESAPATVGNTPQRQADLIWNISPRYNFNDVVTVGAQWVGTDDSPSNFENTLTQDGYSVVHFFINYNITEDFTVSLNVNNLFDETGVTESANDGRIIDADGDGTNDHTVARSILGRTASASVRFNF